MKIIKHKIMAQSYLGVYIHYIFSTKNRERTIKPKIENRLRQYMTGIAKEHNMKTLAIGGVEDHMHILASLPSDLSIAKAIQFMKGGSSKWIHETFSDCSNFKWQKGYGAFSVSISHIEKTIAYIDRQKEHHKRVTFQEEYIAFLKKNRIEYDERYIWG